MLGSVARSLGDGGAWVSRWARALFPTDDERKLRATFGEPVLTPGEVIWFAWTRRLFPDHRILTPPEAAEFSQLCRDETRRGIDAGILPWLKFSVEGDRGHDDGIASDACPCLADQQPIGLRPVA